MCRKCNNEKSKKYRKTEAGKLAFKKAAKNWNSKNREKVRIWYLARRTGSGPCEVCGATKTHRHHPDYDNPTKVVFLCPLHHKQLHSILNKN